MPRAPRICGVVGLVLSPVLAFTFAQIASQAQFADESVGGLIFNNFLNRAALIVIVISGVLALITALKPLPSAIVLPENTSLELKSSPIAKAIGIGVVVSTIVLYVVFA